MTQSTDELERLIKSGTPLPWMKGGVRTMKPIAKFFASGFLCGMAVVLVASGIRDLQNPPPNLPPADDFVVAYFNIGVACVERQYAEGERLFFNCDDDCKSGLGEGAASACESGRLMGSARAYYGFEPKDTQ